jgi:hypothetical protein
MVADMAGVNVSGRLGRFFVGCDAARTLDWTISGF